MFVSCNPPQVWLRPKTNQKLDSKRGKLIKPQMDADGRGWENQFSSYEGKREFDLVADVRLLWFILVMLGVTTSRDLN